MHYLLEYLRDITWVVFFCFQFLEEKQERSSGLGCDDRFRSDVMLWPSTRTFFIFYFFNSWTHFTHLVRASDERATNQPTNQTQRKHVEDKRLLCD